MFIYDSMSEQSLLPTQTVPVLPSLTM